MMLVKDHIVVIVTLRLQVTQSTWSPGLYIRSELSCFEIIACASVSVFPVVAAYMIDAHFPRAATSVYMPLNLRALPFRKLLMTTAGVLFHFQQYSVDSYIENCRLWLIFNDLLARESNKFQHTHTAQLIFPRTSINLKVAHTFSVGHISKFLLGNNI